MDAGCGIGHSSMYHLYFVKRKQHTPFLNSTCFSVFFRANELELVFCLHVVGAHHREGLLP
jgi:hypothetical protein